MHKVPQILKFVIPLMALDGLHCLGVAKDTYEVLIVPEVIEAVAGFEEIVKVSHFSGTNNLQNLRNTKSKTGQHLHIEEIDHRRRPQSDDPGPPEGYDDPVAGISSLLGYVFLSKMSATSSGVPQVQGKATLHVVLHTTF